jgi:hypothetical protein
MGPSSLALVRGFMAPTTSVANVNNAYHPSHGYKGAMPARGEKAEPTKRVDSGHFTGSEERDGRGHVTEAKH